MISIRELQSWEAAWDPDRYDRLRLALQEGGCLVAMGEIAHLPWQFAPRRYRMELLLDPELEGRGLRQRLYGALDAALEERGAEETHARVTDLRRRELQFYQARGFQKRQRMRESRLAVTAFDFEQHTGVEARLRRQRVRIISLADAGSDDPQVRGRAYELEMELGRDVPIVGGFTPIPFEEWLRRVVESERSLPEAYLLAEQGGRYLGVSLAQPSLAEAGVLWQQLTGVRREVRRAGVARALKLALIRFARDHGYTEIRTQNDVTNRAILGLNDAMGYRTHHHWIELVRDNT